jgi:sortase A
VPHKEGDAGGFIEIPRIGLRQKTFVEGVTKADLRKGPGHYPETPLPGQAGNAAIAGHRTTYGAPFNRIDELLPGDAIIIYTSQGKFVYEVMAPPEGIGIERGKGWFTVRPSDSSVLAPTGDNRLTLTACHPKYSAAERIIVQAKLVAEPAATTPTTTAAPGSTQQPAVVQASPSDREALIAGDHSALMPAVLYGAAALAVWMLGWLGAVFFRRAKKRGFYGFLIVTPGFAALLWFCFVYVDRYLPAF